MSRLAEGITQKVVIIVGLMLFTTSLLDLLGGTAEADFTIPLATLVSLRQQCLSAAPSAATTPASHVCPPPLDKCRSVLPPSHFSSTQRSPPLSSCCKQSVESAH